ncbi:hypothetical protein GCM10010172_04020 [Paractinoplanes ferrugineus]|uniref:Peptidoglycan binding-like domain-containing protein n=1 Tax=Paractinoplanes ferrugineus TaxID=113564 RepID=A0A919J5N9_9ACTN|nr:hypothetical protein Afe05nite_56470 [Actinoplanes ferrugineus]
MPQEQLDGEAISAVLDRRRRRRIVIGVVAVMAVAAGGAVVVTYDRNSGQTDPIVTVPTGTVEVTEGTLVARTSVSGTLGYAGSYTAVNQASGSYTYLPPVGRTVSQGDVLYRVDEKPVVFFMGTVPMYRDLDRDLKGRDVQQLNAALVAAGYDADGRLEAGSSRYTWATASAVRDLQKHLHVERTGRVSKSDVVFAGTSKLRVASLAGQVGGSAATGSAVLTGSSTDRHVTVGVDASLQSRLKAGEKVTLTLPTGKTVDGAVSSVGTVVTKTSSGGSQITVIIKPSKTSDTGRLDQAPVGVSIITESVDNVLMVPVNALLALLGGGYGIEVVEPSGVRKLAPVELGLFDDTAGTVQITGNAVAAGQKVVVPTT